MKKGDMVRVTMDRTVFPGRGRGTIEDQGFEALGAFPGETIEGRFTRRNKGVGIIKHFEVMEPAEYSIEPRCKHFRKCGGCLSQHVPLEMQRAFKEREVLDLFRNRGITYQSYKGISGFTRPYYYRNKMEFSFGDPYKDGPLHLGLHQRGMGKNILDTDDCQLISRDMNAIRTAVADYYRKKGYPYYHIMKREGYLRHLILRESYTNGDLMVTLVTTSAILEDFSEFIELLTELPLKGTLKSVWHVTNDLPSDAVNVSQMVHLYGEKTIEEEMLGLSFHISPLSFFQTNTEAARLLYQKTLDLIEASDQFLDLYCGTGTLTQLVSKKASHVTGVEIIEDAVKDAKKSARENGIFNVSFIAGDVKTVLPEMSLDVDGIIVDPPRSGIHPKVVEALKDSGVKTIVYVSCNPKTLALDLSVLKETYTIESLELIDMYPNTPHVEAVVLMSRA